MAIELIDRADFDRRIELREVAVHESGHAHIAQNVFGCALRELYVRGNGSGLTTISRPQSVTLDQRAQIVLAGGCAAYRFYEPGRRAGKKSSNIADYWGADDYAVLESLAKDAASTEFDQADWLWRQVAETHRLVKREWSPIKALAREIIARGGVYLIETMPRPKPSRALLDRAMEMVWGSGQIYP